MMSRNETVVSAIKDTHEKRSNTSARRLAKQKLILTAFRAGKRRSFNPDCHRRTKWYAEDVMKGTEYETCRFISGRAVQSRRTQRCWLLYKH
ncbi:hypothetical protein PO124_16675 [Bacillus licheniformis]|nr:hypothetical protein [Bacillus licheniformis]